MPTDISNAVGTARQFTPQPDNLYRGNYQGVGANTAASSATNSTDDLAQNMMQIDSALQGYMVHHEKYLDAKGHNEAESMINSMSPADIKKLNVIDAAQNEGYVDSTSNPYFKAYADRLRGTFLSSQMKLEYDNKYSMTPARSMDEEAKRYADFSSQWKKDNAEGDKAPLNPYAFNIGFNENQLVNINNLASSWSKKKHEDDITNVMAATQSQLGDVIENSSELLKSNGLMTNAVQSIFNQTRLMGLPQSYRQKLLDDFCTEIVKTGHIDSDKLSQMMDKVVVSTDMTGTPTKASDLLDMQTYKTMAAAYNKQFVTKWKYDTIQKFVKTKDRQGFLQYLEDTRNNDPDKAPEVASMWGAVDGGITQKENEEKRIKEMKLKALLEQQKNAFKNQQQVNNMNGALSVWMNGGTMYNGQTISSLKFDPQLSGSKLAESVDYILKTDDSGNFVNESDMSPNSRAKYLSNVMSFPTFSQARKDIINQYGNSIDSIQPDGNGGATYSQTAYNLVNLYQANSADFSNAFGTEMTSKVGLISIFSTAHGGDINAGLADYAAYNVTDKDVIRDYESSAKYQLSGYTIDDMPVLGGGVTTAKAYNSEDAIQMLTKVSGALMSKGYDDYTAVNNAAGIVRDSMVYFQGAYIPKGAFNNIGTPNDEVYMSKALNRWCYDVASDGNADVRYNSNSQTFFVSGDLDSKSFSLNDMRSRAYDIYAEEANEGKSSGNNSGSLNANDINEQRHSEDKDESVEEIIDNNPDPYVDWKP